EFGPWRRVGAEVVSGGYDVTWKNGTAYYYTAWKPAASATLFPSTPVFGCGSDPALEGLETTLKQDLNGDGTVGAPPPMAIETKGDTELARSGNNYVMLPVAGGSSALLQYQGAAVTACEFGPWAPVRAAAGG